MNIFEELDKLINKKSIITESKESDDKVVPTIKDAPEMQTAEQGRLYIRDVFRKMMEDGGRPPGGQEPPEPPRKIEGVKAPNPFRKEGGDDKKSKDFEEGELVWDDDELETLKLDGDEDDDEFGEDSDFYDNFEDEKNDRNDEDEDEDGDDGDDQNGNNDPNKQTEEPGEPFGNGDKKDGDNQNEPIEEPGEPFDNDEDGDDNDNEEPGIDKKNDQKGKSSNEKNGNEKSRNDNADNENADTTATTNLKKTIDDAIEKLKERAEANKEKLEKLSEMTKEGATEEDIDSLDKDIEAEKSEKMNALKDLVGRTEDVVSKDDIKKEIEAGNLSEEEKQKLSDIGESAVEAPPTPIDDAEMTKLKQKAVNELEKKCKGHSSLGQDILYHAMKDAEIENQDWKKILEQILKSKSKHSGVEDSKVKKNAWGNKNHLWRNAVLPGKKDKIGGIDTQSVYCFLDYSGSVRCMTMAIISFLGKVMELSIRLEYTELHVYTFAEELSLPKVITKAMIDKDGYEKVLSSVLEFFDHPDNYVGESHEDFSLVAQEINNIKHKDKNAVAFIFGDGLWAFDGKSDPPVRLKELCPRWLKDICIFLFYPDTANEYRNERFAKEIAYLKDVANIEHIITTKLSSVKHVLSS